MAGPAGDEPGMIDAALGFAQHYLPLPAVTLLAGLLWRGSARVAQFEMTQAEHEKRLTEHSAKILALEAADTAARVVVAGLPTKEDLRTQTEQLQHQTDRLQQQIQSGFETIARMVGNRG